MRLFAFVVVAAAVVLRGLRDGLIIERLAVLTLHYGFLHTCMEVSGWVVVR